LKSWKIYIALFIVGFVAGLSDTAHKPASLDTVASQGIRYTFSVSSNSTSGDIFGEQPAGFHFSCPAQISLSTNIKDFHDHVENPFTENQIIEQRIVSYLILTKTFPHAESLSQLNRLNI